MVISAMVWLQSTTARALAVSACVGVPIATLVCAVPSAVGETEPTSGAVAVTCPSPNPPNMLALTAGTPQSSPLGSFFATDLQVAFTNSNGCPVTTAIAGTPVTFSAPSAGASGLFSASESNTVTVGSDATGTAAASTFIASAAAGSYAVIARSAYGSVSFDLTNVEASNSSGCGALVSATVATGGAPAGKPTKLAVGVGATQSAVAGTRFPIRLAVTVTNAEKTPVPGVLVTFMASNRGPSGYFTVRSSGAKTPVSHARRSRTSHPLRVEVKTDACGIAVAPTFTANHHDGGYVVLASVERLKAAFALVNEGQ